MSRTRRLLRIVTPCAVLSACISDVRLGPASRDDAGADSSSAGGVIGVDADSAAGAIGADATAGAAGIVGSGGSGGTAGQSDQCNATGVTPGTSSVTVAGLLGGGGSGASAPVSAQAVVLWASSSAPANEAYVWGQGTFNGSAYNISLPTDPPSEATFGQGLAVGHVVLLNDTYVYEPGLLDAAGISDLQSHLVGWNFIAAVIWKPPGSSKLGYWPDLFGDRYSCGNCCFFQDNNPACCYAPGETGDAFTPGSCGSVPLQPASSAINVCKWK